MAEKLQSELPVLRQPIRLAARKPWGFGNHRKICVFGRIQVVSFNSRMASSEVMLTKIQSVSPAVTVHQSTARSE
jgi:hypothetical protein